MWHASHFIDVLDSCRHAQTHVPHARTVDRQVTGPCYRGEARFAKGNKLDIMEPILVARSFHPDLLGFGAFLLQHAAAYR